MNWGDCDHTGRVGDGGDGKNAAYHCRVNSVPLVHDELKNYAYPWRDNFCEHRYYYVGQCPAGLGHQGQDIRPGSCLLRNEGADRCEPYQHDRRRRARRRRDARIRATRRSISSSTSPASTSASATCT